VWASLFHQVEAFQYRCSGAFCHPRFLETQNVEVFLFQEKEQFKVIKALDVQATDLDAL
jgi:hypothetical protein